MIRTNCGQVVADESRAVHADRLTSILGIEARTSDNIRTAYHCKQN